MYNFPGTPGNDIIVGSPWNDRILGLAGNDSLSGGAGNDAIEGGLGRDTLTGGTGNDWFVYRDTRESQAGANRDVIKDFLRGSDKIDLRSIDANPFNSKPPGFNPNDAFTWKGLNGKINGIGQVRYILSGGNAILQVNTDRNFDNFEMEIQLNSVTYLSSADLAL